jgi:hypothetical protein
MTFDPWKVLEDVKTAEKAVANCSSGRFTGYGCKSTTYRKCGSCSNCSSPSFARGSRSSLLPLKKNELYSLLHSKNNSLVRFNCITNEVHESDPRGEESTPATAATAARGDSEITENVYKSTTYGPSAPEHGAATACYNEKRYHDAVREIIRHLDRLSANRLPCPGLQLRVWIRLHAAAVKFMVTRGEAALSEGWNVTSLLGVHPVVGAHRIDYTGALLTGSTPINQLSADTITYQNGLKFRRVSVPDDAVPVWAFGQGELHD